METKPMVNEMPEFAVKSKRALKAALLKEELKDVIDRHKDDVEVQQREAEVLPKAKSKKVYDVIVIDAQNVDDRKKVIDYMREGRIILDPEDKPFILAEQPSKNYNPFKPPIHKVFCEGIKGVSIRKAYMDLEMMAPGGRTLIRETIWLYHSGFETFSIITQEQLQYLLDNNFVKPKMITYTYSDASTGGSYFLGTDSTEPDKDKIASLDQEEMKNHQKAQAKNSFNCPTDETVKDDEEEVGDSLSGESENA